MTTPLILLAVSGTCVIAAFWGAVIAIGRALLRQNDLDDMIPNAADVARTERDLGVAR